MKYKLIQTYPGYEKLGKIEDSENGAHTGWQGTIFYDANPKYWQKVEEVDYEILTVTPSDKNTTNPNKEAVITYKICNKDLEFWNIHSVKRLSDGEVFTIGDILQFESFEKKTLVIDRFEVDFFDKNKISARGEMYGKGDINIWKKLPKKTPLFTTEDGIELYEGDCCYYVRKIDCRYESDFLKKGDKCNGHWISFSTKEKAEEYILLNKPCLSLNDLLSVWKECVHIRGFKDIHLYEKIRELAKSKL